MGGMKLAAYLTKHQERPSAFAARVGVTPEAIRLYIKGARRPRADIIAKIAGATGRSVTANDFFPNEAEASNAS